MIEKKFLFFVNLLIPMTFGLMLLGAGVRTMDAGLTCPDWPLCFGKIIPSYHFGVYLEWVHRVWAGCLSLGFFYLFFFIWKNEDLKKLRQLSFSAVFLLLSQILMGGLTVWKRLDFMVVTFHLSLATAFWIVLCLMKYKVYDLQKSLILVHSNRKSWFYLFKTQVFFGFFLVCLQIFLGGLVASTYSGLICVDFPTCNGQFFPPLQGPIALQMFHRFTAYILFSLGFSLVFFSFSQKGRMFRIQKVLSLKIFLLLVTQVFVGVLNLKLLLPPWLSVLHLALALGVLFHFIQLIHCLRVAPTTSPSLF